MEKSFELEGLWRVAITKGPPYRILVTSGIGREQEVFRNLQRYAKQDQYELENSAKDNDMGEAVDCELRFLSFLRIIISLC